MLCAAHQAGSVSSCHVAEGPSVSAELEPLKGSTLLTHQGCKLKGIYFWGWPHIIPVYATDTSTPVKIRPGDTLSCLRIATVIVKICLLLAVLWISSVRAKLKLTSQRWLWKAPNLFMQVFFELPGLLSSWSARPGTLQVGKSETSKLLLEQLCCRIPGS